MSLIQLEPESHRPRLLVRLLGRLEHWERFHHLLAEAAQISIFAVAMVAAYLLRFDFTVPPHYANHLRLGVLVCVLIKPLVFHAFKMDRGWWRFVSVHDVARLTWVNAVASAAAAVTILLWIPQGFPRSIYLLDFVLALMGTAGIRIITRMAVTAAHQQTSSRAKRVLIYGAGAAGIALANEIRANAALGYELLGFVDDNARKAGVRLHGLQVHGGGALLAELSKAIGVQELLIALPSASAAAMNQVLEHCERAKVNFRTVPALSELVEGRGLASQIREVAVEDLLGRLPVRLELPRIGEILHQQVVLVTGAAGSIGAELCRQIARFQPARLIAVDVAESPLFNLQQTMRGQFPALAFEPRVGSVQNEIRLREILTTERPRVVYHAAAYKHVPMMERHPFEAVENNVLGTDVLIRSVMEAGVERFVLISTDKAVRPQNVMGATKRVAELMVASRSLALTRMVAVRFGNVLGSNGSVVPTFKRQIAEGGPVTVTHPEMTRFFMTIPEACQLVLQASAMGQGGEIFVLDMGQPVRILDLARKLILLSGRRPDEDVQIEFTGVRPGEKLSEELNSRDEDMTSTPHEKIRIFSGPHPSAGALEDAVAALQDACARRDLHEVLRIFAKIVPDYSPSPELEELLSVPRTGLERAARVG